MTDAGKVKNETTISPAKSLEEGLICFFGAGGADTHEANWSLVEGGTSKQVRLPETTSSDEASQIEEAFRLILQPAIDKHGLLDIQHNYVSPDGHSGGHFVVEMTPSSKRVGFVTLDLSQAVERLHSILPDFGKSLEGLLETDTVPAQPTLSVRPKLDGTRWLSVLSIARNWQRVEIGKSADVDRGPDDFRYHLVGAYLGALESLFSNYGGLRQTHRRVSETLESTVRGRLRVPEYLRGVSRGELTRVPCEYSDLRLDHLANQALLYAIRIARRICKQIHPQLHDKLSSGDHESGSIIRELNTWEARFGGIRRTRISPSELSNLEHLPTAFDGYRKSGALELAEFLIRNVHLGDESGAYTTVGFSVDMWRAFESAFAQLVEEQIPGAISQANWDVKIVEPGGDFGHSSGSQTFKPDVFVPADSSEPRAPIVADTKWKFGVSTSQSPEGTEEDPKIPNQTRLNISLHNSDIYQITSYTHVAAANKPSSSSRAIGALVFPSDSLPGSDDLPPACEVQWTAEDNTPSGIDVYVVPWKVTDSWNGTRINGKQVVRKLSEIAHCRESP